MKKAVSILLILTIVIAALSISASAADPMAATLQDSLDALDHFYDYDAYYMYVKACDDFITWEDDAPKIGRASCREKV